jgi:tetratricopeptide (TPR) repeat protein
VEPARRLIRELVSLRRARAWRALDVRLAGTTTTLFIRAGELAGVNPEPPPFAIGRILVRRKLITREQYIEVLQRLNDATTAGHAARFGELAVGLGYVSAEDTTKCLVEQARWPAVRLFLRAVNDASSLTWTSSELARAPADQRWRVAPVEAIFLDALRRCDAGKCVEVAGATAQTSALAAEWDFAQIDDRFELVGAEASFVREALAGARTARDLLANEPPPGVDANAIVAALLAIGAAASRAPAPAPVQHAPPPSASDRRPPPEWAVIDPTVAKDVAVKAVAARGAGEGAAGGPFAGTLKAEQSFERGRDLFRRGDVKRALPFLEAALTALGTDECELLVRWSRLWMHQQGLTTEEGAKLEVRARAVLADDPDLAFAHFALGEALHAQGRLDDARKHLINSLRLDKDVLEGIRDRRLATMRGSPGRRPSDGQLRASSSDLGDVPRFPKSDPAILVGVPPAPTASARDSASAVRAPRPAAPPVPTMQEIEQLAATSEAAATERRRSPLILGGVLGVVGLGAILGVVAAGWDFAPAPSHAPSSVTSLSARSATVPTTVSAAPSAELTPTPMPTPTSTPTPTNAAPATLDASAASASAAPATEVIARAGDAGAVEPTMGRVLLPSTALGHRIFVDGRVAGSDVNQLVVPCGQHDVRIGSHGATHSVDVPCGAELDLRANKSW